MYDGNGRLIRRYRANGRPLREYIRLGTRPVATSGKNGHIHYVHTDHLGTPRAVSEPGGGVVWRWISGPFGDTAPDERAGGPGKSFTFNLRFPGQYHDEETGTNYNYWRTYDPSIGRYVTPDPMGLDGGMNTYLYGDGSPAMKVDPDGKYARVPCFQMGCLPIDWPDMEPSEKTKCQLRCGMDLINPIPDAFFEKITEWKFGSAGKGVTKKVNKYQGTINFSQCMTECAEEDCE